MCVCVCVRACACVCARVCVCVCVHQRDHFNCFLIPAESTLNTYCLNNASLYEGLLLFVYTHNENKKRKQIGSLSAIWVSFLWTN